MADHGDEDVEFAETTTIDVTKKELEKFKIGDKITVTLKGTIGMLQTPPDGEEDEFFKPSIGFVVESKEIKGKNVFAAMVEDEGED